MGRKVENVKVGDVIKDHADEEGNPVNMVVIGVYKHCVVAQKKNGIRRGISFGELVQRGLEPGYRGRTYFRLQHQCRGLRAMTW